MPPSFKNPKIINQAQEYARILVEQQQEAHSSKLLSPQEVVMDVVPKVLQGIWVPRLTTFFNMPSQKLSVMAVGVTQAVLDRVSSALSTMLHKVSFSCSMRDEMVLSILGKVRQIFSPDTLRMKLRRFEPELLNVITDVAVEQICELFKPQTKSVLEGEVRNEQPSEEPALQTVHDATQNDPYTQQGEVTKGRIQRFFRWFQKAFCCCFLPEDED